VKIRKICFGFSIAIATLSTLLGYSLVLEASRGSSLVASAYPSQMELQIFPAPNRKATNPICPKKVTITETPRPNIQAAYIIDGIAKLDEIAERFSVFAVDDFSVTWAAKLKPKYLDCYATGRVLKVNGDERQGHFRLRLRLVEGKVFLILDITGVLDLNELTTSIYDYGVKDGNPIWAWGGTD
jgi:hypothetical protein